MGFQTENLTSIMLVKAAFCIAIVFGLIYGNTVFIENPIYGNWTKTVFGGWHIKLKNMLLLNFIPVILGVCIAATYILYSEKLQKNIETMTNYYLLEWILVNSSPLT